MTQQETQRQTQRELAGRARAAGASRGAGGEFLPDDQHQRESLPPNNPQKYVYISEGKTKTKRLTLKTLYEDVEWWNALADQYPGVNLHAELLKSLDWHRVHLVRSPKIYFRHWVEKAYRQLPEREMTADERRARLAIA